MQEKIIKINYKEKEYIFNIIKGINYYIYYDYENDLLYKTKVKLYDKEVIQIIIF